MDVGIWAWAGFLALILGLLALDLFVFHKEAHEDTFKEATKFSIFWISLGLAFGVLVYFWLGPQAGGEYFAGYLIEKSLSVDNIFVFALIFTYFGVPAIYQHRVLFWGILGALVFRALFIAGGRPCSSSSTSIYIFGAFLVLTGVRMALHRDGEVHPERNPALKLFRRVVPMTSEYHGQHFTVVDAGRRVATPLLAVLVLIETSDILFAVDSIPAIFAVTDDPFIVFTSNAFAILGLRALYFMLAGMIHRFVYLKIGLAVVLVYVGFKMLVSTVYKIPIWASLTFIAVAITVSVVASLRSTRARRPGPSPRLTPKRSAVRVWNPSRCRAATTLGSHDERLVRDRRDGPVGTRRRDARPAGRPGTHPRRRDVGERFRRRDASSQAGRAFLHRGGTCGRPARRESGRRRAA